MQIFQLRIDGDPVVHFTVIQIKLCFPVALQFRDFLGLERFGRCECLSRGDMPLAAA